MKKMIVLVVSVLLLLNLSAGFSVSAESTALTKEQHDAMLEAIDFVGDMYLFKHYYYNVDFVLRIAEMYPESVVYQYEEYGMHYGTVQASNEQILATAKTVWPNMSDNSIKKYLIEPLEKWEEEVFGEKKEMHSLSRGAAGGYGYCKNASTGLYKGYTANEDGTYSFYTAVPKEAFELLSEEECNTLSAMFGEISDQVSWEEYERLYYWDYDKDANWSTGITYKDMVFKEGPETYLTNAVTDIRVFTFKKVDGKIDFISDQWDVSLPAAFSAVDGDNVTYQTPSGVTVFGSDKFANGTVVTVNTVKAGKAFETAKAAMIGISSQYVVYDFSALNGGKTVQPNGKVKVVFSIPENLSANHLRMFYVDDKGKTEGIALTVDAAKMTATAELEHFSTYVLAQVNAEKSPKTGDTFNPAVYIVLAVASVFCMGYAIRRAKKV